MGHELDRKNVCMMACANTSIQGKATRLIFRVEAPDIEVCIVGPRSKKLTTRRPTMLMSVGFKVAKHDVYVPQCIDTPSVTSKLVDDVKVLSSRMVTIEWSN